MLHSITLKKAALLSHPKLVAKIIIRMNRGHTPAT
jgi:hypothetical protein